MREAYWSEIEAEIQTAESETGNSPTEDALLSISRKLLNEITVLRKQIVTVHTDTKHDAGKCEICAARAEYEGVGAAMPTGLNHSAREQS